MAMVADRPHALAAQMPPPLAPIVRLAFNLRWVWNHAADRLWEACNAEVARGLEVVPGQHAETS
jgi:hypothetical protein